MVRKILISILFIFVVNTGIKAQSFGIGLSGMYNFQTESFGAGVRLEFPLGRAVSLVPQFNYYPSFNKIYEYYGGVALHLHLFKIRSWRFYVLAHGAYNAWINYETSHMKDASYSNWDFEAGAGITTTWCLRPFIEYRYNVKWYETALHAGLIYFFNCGGKGNGSNRRGKKKYKIMHCPAYD